jgi:CBS domain-containing protein
MKVAECMTRPVEYVGPEDTIEDAARLMAEIDAGILPVLRSGQLVGMVSDRDIAIRAVGRGEGPGTRVSEVMSGGVLSCSIEDDVDAVLEEMADYQIRRVPVLDPQAQVVGIVSLSDMANVTTAESGRALLLIARPSSQHSQLP